MSVRVITPPEPVVTFEEAAKHLRLDDDEERDYVTGLIAAAQGWIDGPAGWLGRSVGVQELEWRDDCLPARLPFHPVIEVDAATVDGEAADLPAWTDEGNLAWPLGVARGATVIRYRAGYGKPNDASPPVWINDAPAPIKVAILMLVAQWYMARAAVNIGNIVNEMPFAVEALLQPYRVYR